MHIKESAKFEKLININASNFQKDDILPGYPVRLDWSIAAIVDVVLALTRLLFFPLRSSLDIVRAVVLVEVTNSANVRPNVDSKWNLNALTGTPREQKGQIQKCIRESTKFALKMCTS
eukprot:Nk52_evm84s1737 gene=Nk52_evmTU84s1737